MSTTGEERRLLEPAGEDGMAVRALDLTAMAHCQEVFAMGEAGTVYLCHPFLVHAAQINRGKAPRFMAQPPLFPKKHFDVQRHNASNVYPVEAAMRRALERRNDAG
jgi:hypothetical protein